MTQKIKKVKQMQQNGQWSADIPIGADAINVDMQDGESVESKLNKKPYYYNTISSMKTDTKLKNNDMVIILGTDNGIRKEYIIENEGDILLNNGLYAKEIKEESADFIFPKFWEDAPNGDLSLIKYKNKVIMIDTYKNDMWTNVKQMLLDNSISHIDYLILTHYHADHVGNVENLYNDGYIDSNTNYYFPGESPTRFGFDSQIAYYKSFCETNNLSYYVPENDEVLNIDENFKITFTNCDGSLYDNYYTSNEQNQISTICLIEFKQIKALFTGDAYKSTENFLLKTNFVKSNVNLYKIPHHSINNSCEPLFLQIIKPEYAVQIAGISRYAAGEFANSAEAKILNSFNTKIFATFMNDNYITFKTNGYIFNNIKGKSYNGANGRILYDLYVDENAITNHIQNGSQEYPFSEIAQAITELSSMPFIDEGVIHIAEGNYGYSALSAGYPLDSEFNRINLYNSNVIYTLTGDSEDSSKVVINGIYAKKIKLRLQNLTLDNDNHNEGIYLDKCTADIENVVITSKTNTTHHNGIYSRNSEISVNNFTADYCNYVFNLNYNTNLSYNNFTYGSYNNNLKTINNSTILEKNYTFTNTSEKYNNLKFYGNKIVPSLLYYNNTPEYTATDFSLNVNPRDFRSIEIEYIDTEGRIGSTGRITAPQNRWIDIFTSHLQSGNILEYGLSIQLGTDKFTIYTPFSKTTNISTGNVTIDTTRKISITRINGYFEDVVNDLR